MKFKEQYRWLLFLLLPFIVLMIMLFLIPLEFVLNAQPLATQQYNSQKAEMEQFPVRASVVALTQKLSNQLTGFNELTNLYFQAQQVHRFISVNIGKINMFNAQKYYQNYVSSTGRKENVSMWFASEISTVDSLKPLQLAAYNQYAMFEPYLRSYFFSGGDSVIKGVFVFYRCGADGDLVFQFPSYADSAYARADLVVNSSLYETAVNNYAKTNSTMLTVVDYSNSLIDGPLLLACTLILGNAKTDPAKGVLCLKLDLSLLSEGFMGDFVRQEAANEGYDFLSLMSPTLDQSKSSQILANISFESTKIQPNFPVNQIYQTPNFLPKKTFASQSLLSIPQNQKFNVYRIHDKIYYILPIYLQNMQTKYCNPSIYILMQNNFKIVGTQLEYSNINANTLNTLLIPTIILILLSFVISIFVLRSLLNGLDQQLFKLNDRCKFIVDGDIEIDIPEFKGAKDIADVYEQVRIINKLHRYTSKEYFAGHSSNKIFKYNQALQVIKKLNYDPSYLMENIGEAYFFIEQYDKSIFFLKESVRILETKLQQEFGSIDTMFNMKQQKQKIPMAYRQSEIILIRRLWKLVFSYFKYVDMTAINSKSLDDQLISDKDKQLKKERLQRELAENITKMKKALYPDYKSYAECCMLLSFEISMFIKTNNMQAAKDSLGRCNKVVQLYCKEYDENTKKLKEKGSKNLFFFKKNRLSAHSRSSPQCNEAFYNYIRALILILDPKSRDYYTAAVLLFQALQKGFISQNVNYVIFVELKKLFATLKMSMDKLQTTQLFHQSMPYKTLHYGPLTKEIQAGLYKIARNQIEVQSREYVFFLDSSQTYVGEQLLNTQIKYIHQRSCYLFDKIIKKFDRVSFTQCNSDTGFVTHCSLTLKEGNEAILKKSLTDMMKGLNYSGQNELLYSLETILFRVRQLQCEKIVMIFLKHMDSYSEERTMQNRPKSKSKRKRKTQQTQKSFTERETKIDLLDIGEGIEHLMINAQTRNLKLILVCAEGDDYTKVINTFGLKDINRRIWAKTEGLNKFNNLVYIIDDKHKIDLDRILTSKLARVPDNHVFAL